MMQKIYLIHHKMLSIVLQRFPYCISRSLDFLHYNFKNSHLQVCYFFPTYSKFNDSNYYLRLSVISSLSFATFRVAVCNLCDLSVWLAELLSHIKHTMNKYYLAIVQKLTAKKTFIVNLLKCRQQPQQVICGKKSRAMELIQLKHLLQRAKMVFLKRIQRSSSSSPSSPSGIFHRTPSRISSISNNITSHKCNDM